MVDDVRKKYIKIGNALVGPNRPCYIIAEGGVNHNGDVALAKQLIKKAKESGADCIKFQTFKAASVAIRNAPKAGYQLRLQIRRKHSWRC